MYLKFDSRCLSGRGGGGGGEGRAADQRPPRLDRRPKGDLLGPRTGKDLIQRLMDLRKESL